MAAAFDVVSRMVDYIPFKYLLNGCYARSLYMAMELGVAGFPTSALYVYGNLHPRPGLDWNYHVAPLLEDDNRQQWVFDPSFQSSPLTISKWISKLKTQGEYTTEIKAGNFFAEGRARPLVSAAFRSSDISLACESMYNYILEYDAATAEEQREKLLARTAVLISDLKKQGNMENDGLGNEKESPCAAAVLKGLDPGPSPQESQESLQNSCRYPFNCRGS